MDDWRHVLAAEQSRLYAESTLQCVYLALSFLTIGETDCCYRADEGDDYGLEDKHHAEFLQSLGCLVIAILSVSVKEIE